ncbi:MAG TPA: SDR family oxidoreductase [Edaphobacter sp.]|nr:SDR family oxidoreductase [Edaphobacter sp.]
MAAVQAGSFTVKVALVTGGSKGIGESIVRRLASDGAAVAFTYSSSEEKARQLVRGILLMGTVDNFSLEDFDRMIAVNVRAAFVGIQSAAQQMSDGGRIILIGSNTAIRTAFPGGSIYSMTKAALTGLVRGAAIDLAPRAITVNNIQPGPTMTDMSGAHAVLVKNLIPLKRMGDVSEIAGFVAYPASHEAGFITGASLTIDGGYVA